MKFLFFGIVFVAFGTGVRLSQLIGEKLANGYWFLSFGFLLLITSLITKELKPHELVE